MDYNDNDYQSHLAGEDSSKGSSVLHSYALPKFDFDDSLQGHLRFDSLVENEVFLGIPSQEDNQWIEDFSRASSGIEFSSSAAESCSIPRRHNVWSEATSTESVEMLLKSVGQEEMVPGDTIIEGSDAGNELACLTHPVESSLKLDDKRDDVKESGSAAPIDKPDEFTGTFSRGERSQSQDIYLAYAPETQVVETQEVEMQEVEPIVDGSSNITGERCSGVKTGEKLETEIKSVDENLGEGKTSPNESIPEKSDGLSSVPVIQSAIDECLTDSLPVSVEKLDSQLNLIERHREDTSGLPSEHHKSEEEHFFVSKESSMGDEKFHGSAAKSETCTSSASSLSLAASELKVAKELSPETRMIKFEEPCEQGNQGSLTTDGCKEDTSSVEPPETSRSVEVFSKGLEDEPQAEGNSILCEDKKACVTQHCLETTDPKDQENGSNAETENVATLHVSDGLNALAHEGNFLGSCSPPNLSTSEAFTSSEISEPLKQNSPEGPSIIQEVPVSAEFVLERPVPENLETGNVSDKMSKEDACAGDHVSLPVPAESMDICAESCSSMAYVAATNEDVSNVKEKEDVQPVENEMWSSRELDHGVKSSSAGEEHEQISAQDEGSKLESSTLNKQASTSGTGAIATAMVDHDEKLKPVSVMGGSVHSAENEEMKEVLGTEAEVSTSKEPAEVVGQLGPSSADGKDASGDTHMEISPLMVDRNLATQGNPDTASHVEQAAVSEAISESSRHVEVCAISSGLTKKEGSTFDGKDASGVETVELEKNQEKSGVEGRSDVIDGLKSDSAAVISCTALSPSEKKMIESRSRPVVENAVPLVDKLEISGKPLSTSLSAGENTSTKADRSFTFDATPLAGSFKGEADNSITSTQACQMTEHKLHLNPGDGVHLTCGSKQANTKNAQEISQVTPHVPDKGTPSGGAKGERKTRRSSGKSGKENAKKGNQVKEISSSKQSDRGDKSGVPFSPTVAVQKMRYEPGSVDCNVGKSGGVVSYPTSSLPDLNTSSPASTLFHQPFTDLQQVQLRAQIFVYGSLIQGAVPDKACMASAFGTSDSAADGGRSVWDPAWRACDDRIRGQSHTGNNETPLPSRSGPRTPDQASKQVVHQSKVTSSASGRAGGKGTNSPVVSPMIPLSSPLWNMSTPSCDGLPSNGMARGAVIDYKTLSPMHPYQTPPVRNFVGHTASWLPQSPFPGPWVASPQMSAAQRPALPVTELVKLTPVKEASVSISTAAKHEPPDSVIHAGDSGIVAGASPHECKKASVPRKRKKASANEDRVQISLLGTSSESVPAHAIATQLSSKAPISDDLGRSSSIVVAPLVAQSQTGSVAAPVVSGHFSTSVVITPAPTSVPKSNSDILITSTPSSTDLSKKALDIGKIAVISEDLSKVEESRLRAEEAAADAAAAVSHCQDVWNQLGKHKNSDLVSDLEVKLSSAAIAVAAAASVAKAAAAAAKIASNAALQAKLMADKALVAYVPSNPSQTNAASFPVNNSGSSTPASILKLKGWDFGNASGVIFAAREAARRRIEAASAASKHAENLDAIVRAAELAADAVSHAGKIVAIADPLPLSQLVEAGPDGYWKVSQAPSAQGVQEKMVNGGESDISVVGKGPGTLSKRSEGPSDEKTHPMTPTCQPGGVSGNMKEDNLRNKDVTSTPVTGVENDVREAKRNCTPEASKTLSQIAESEDDSGLASPVLETCGNVASSKMREGSLVEVSKDGDDGKRAWYSAKVLALKNGKALVCYTDHQSDEGIKQLKDWVSLDEGSDESPRIRTPHPVTALQGAKKRRRAAVKEYTWYVGDRVDAWIDNRWREGVIAEKNKRDETTFSVNFPDYGDTAVVRAWHLRPTLIWKDGEWVEWSSSRHDFMSQGDTPKEKRVKLGNPASEDMKNDGLSKRVIDEPVNMLPLAVNEKTFNIGSSKNDKKPNTLRTMRSGLQKEGSKVFGVPKPGKKRKFMEVSKHYVSDKASKSDASHDTARFTKYLMPQATGAGGWRNSSRIDSKDKQANEAKRRPPKPNKPSSTTRNLKDNSSASTGDASVAENVVGDEIKFDKSEPRQPNVVNFDEGAEGPMEFSSGAFPSNIPKKASTPSNRKEQLKKRTPLSTSLKSSKVEVKDKSTPEVNEPRRSNRKIQPTSRLLEGIQSSLIITKFPSVSHDKGSRSHSRGASR